MFRTVLLVLTLSVAVGAQTKKSSPETKKTSVPASSTAIIHTTAGDMKCELFPDKTPKAVANFIGLARGTKAWKDLNGKNVMGKPLYDGVIFHRVIPEFMIQGGDPAGTGSGDVGFEFADELRPELLFDKPGRLAMANRGPNTNSSQFFITEVAVPNLNACLVDAGCDKPFPPPNNHVAKGWGYTIFGQCDDATVELVKKIARMPCQAGPCTPSNSRPQNPVKITHVEIVGAPTHAPRKSAPATTSPKPSPSSSQVK